MNKRALLNASRVAVAAGMAATSANAGTTPDPQSPVVTATPAAPPGATAGLEDIVVTAQRRSERLQDVPISVTAITSAALSTHGIMGTSDLAAAVPGVTFNRVLFGIAPSIRGLAQTNPTGGDESATAIYVDGVYISSLGGGFLSFNNIEQIEVLKGPQGTLFGRNAAAGVINVTTRTPTQKFGLNASVGYGNYGTFEGNLYVSGGLADGVAMDLAVYGRDQSQGWGKDLYSNLDAYTGKEINVRSKLVAQLGDDTDFTLIGDYSASKDQQGVSIQLLPGVLGQDGKTTFPGFYNTNNDFYSYVTREDYGVSGTLHHDLGRARLVSITAYRAGTKHVLSDTDASPTSITNGDIKIPLHQFTQELQVLSPTSSKIKWIFGGFYMNKREGYDPILLLGAKAPPGYSSYANLATRSFAGFAQVTVPLGDLTHLTGGVRYTSDRQGLTGVTRIAGNIAQGPVDNTSTFNKLTYKAAIDHKLARDVLVYASYSRGFKSGLYSVGSILGPAVRPQTVDAYEVGVKSEFLDHRLRLNVAGFREDISDLQLVQVIQGLPSLFNAAKLRSQGAEVTASAVPVRNLTLSAGVSYIHAVYTDFPNAPLYTPSPTGGNIVGVIPNAKGAHAPQTPELATTAAIDYKIETDSGTFAFTVNHAYVGKQYWAPDQFAVQRAYNMVNGSITWTATSERWNVRGWVRNALGEQIYNYIIENNQGYKGSPAAPRTYGMTIGLKI